MKRKEELEREHDARVAKVRLASALPPFFSRGRGVRWGVIFCVMVVVALVAGVAVCILMGGLPI